MSDKETEKRTSQRRRVARISTSDAIVDRLVGEIMDGTLTAGTELPEVELAGQFGVSRQSLRTALAALVHRGLLEHEPHHSVRVATLTRSDAEDIYRVRQILEGEAIRWLTKRPASWTPVEAALERMRRLPDDAIWGEIAEADVLFHGATVAAVGSPRLDRLHGQLLDEMRLVLVPARNYLTGREMIEEHSSLLEELQRSDPESAVRRLAEHLAVGTDRLLEYLPTD